MNFLAFSKSVPTLYQVIIKNQMISVEHRRASLSVLSLGELSVGPSQTYSQCTLSKISNSFFLFRVRSVREPSDFACSYSKRTRFYTLSCPRQKAKIETRNKKTDWPGRWCHFLNVKNGRTNIFGDWSNFTRTISFNLRNGRHKLT